MLGQQPVGDCFGLHRRASWLPKIKDRSQAKKSIQSYLIRLDPKIAVGKDRLEQIPV
jgi:hypothetical protein